MLTGENFSDFEDPISELKGHISSLSQGEKFEFMKNFVGSLPTPIKTPIEETDPTNEVFQDSLQSLNQTKPSIAELPHLYNVKVPWRDDSDLREKIWDAAQCLTEHCEKILEGSPAEEMTFLLRRLWRYTPSGVERNFLETTLGKALDRAPHLRNIPDLDSTQWFTGADKERNIVGREMPRKDVEKVADFFVHNPERIYTIWTDDVESTQNACDQVFRNPHLRVVSWKEPFKKDWGEWNYLKPLAYKTVAYQSSRASGTGFNPFNASDIMRPLGLIGDNNKNLTDGGTNWDADTFFLKKLPQPITTLLGVLVGAANYNKGSGFNIHEAGREAEFFEVHPVACPRNSEWPFLVLENGLLNLYDGSKGTTFSIIKTGDHDPIGINARKCGTCESGGKINMQCLQMAFGVEGHRYGRVFDAEFPATLALLPEGGYYFVEPAGQEPYYPLATNAAYTWEEFDPWPEFQNSLEQSSSTHDRSSEQTHPRASQGDAREIKGFASWPELRQEQNENLRQHTQAPQRESDPSTSQPLEPGFSVTAVLQKAPLAVMQGARVANPFSGGGPSSELLQLGSIVPAVESPSESQSKTSAALQTLSSRTAVRQPGEQVPDPSPDVIGSVRMQPPVETQGEPFKFAPVNDPKIKDPSLPLKQLFDDRADQPLIANILKLLKNTSSCFGQSDNRSIPSTRGRQ
jgi:hypothetical protein